MVATTSTSLWNEVFSCGFHDPSVMSIQAPEAPQCFLCAEGKAHEENKPIFSGLCLQTEVCGGFCKGFWSPLGN